MAKTVIEDLGVLKNKLINKLLSSSDICTVLLGSDYTQTDVNQLLYQQIFPYLYMDETQTKVMSYICVEITIPRIPTGTIKDLKLTIWAVSHKDCMKYHHQGYTGTKVDILADMIDRIITSEENCRKFGIGTPQLTGVDYFFPQNKYYGRTLTYNLPDFKFKDT